MSDHKATVCEKCGGGTGGKTETSDATPDTKVGICVKCGVKDKALAECCMCLKWMCITTKTLTGCLAEYPDAEWICEVCYTDRTKKPKDDSSDPKQCFLCKASFKQCGCCLYLTEFGSNCPAERTYEYGSSTTQVGGTQSVPKDVVYIGTAVVKDGGVSVTADAYTVLPPTAPAPSTAGSTDTKATEA